MQTVSFQMPEEMKAKLDSFAKAMDRSQSYLMRQAVEEYLEDLSDYLEAKSYKSSYDPSENISLEDLKKKHGLD